MHLLAQLRALRPAPHVWVQRVRAAVDADVGRDERPRADGNEARVEDRAVEVDEDARADLDVRAVVNADGGLDPGEGGEEGVV